MICGAGNGGFIEILLKRGVKKEEIQQLLELKFPDSLIRMWDMNIDFN